MGDDRQTELGRPFSGERDLREDPRACSALRFDIERAIEGCNSLAHADESVLTIAGSRYGEAAPIVFDRENHGIARARPR